jgi:hypothetical protein
MGSIVHKLIDDASRGRVAGGDVRSHLVTIISEFENSIQPENPDRRWIPLEHQPEFNWVMKQGLLKATSLLSEATSGFAARKYDHQRTGSEIRVEARDGCVIGKIDRATQTSDGIVIEDFKSGPLTERPGPQAPPKIAFADQLRLYAAMYAEDPKRGDGEWPVALTLKSLNGRSLDVPFQHSECVDLLDSAVDMLNSVNSILESHLSDEALDLLGRPSPDTCHFCSYRPACPAYRQSRASEPLESPWPRDYWGTVVDKTHLGNRTISLSLQTYVGIVRARGFNPTIHTNLESVEMGEKVAIFSTKSERGANTVGDGPYATIMNISD